MTSTNDISNAEALINQQLEAYNNRDIDAFMRVFAEDIRVYTFPNTLISEGSDTMREHYGAMFETVTDLHAEITKRMVLGNTVIDEEKVTRNGGVIFAIAIYEIENGKVSKVTFIK